MGGPNQGKEMPIHPRSKKGRRRIVQILILALGVEKRGDFTLSEEKRLQHGIVYDIEMRV